MGRGMSGVPKATGVATGVAAEMAGQWRAHPSLAHLCEAGWLHTADGLLAEAGEGGLRLHQGDVVVPLAGGSPIVAFSSGGLSGGAADAFAVHHGDLLGVEVRGVPWEEEPGGLALDYRYAPLAPAVASALESEARLDDAQIALLQSQLIPGDTGTPPDSTADIAALAAASLPA